MRERKQKRHAPGSRPGAKPIRAEQPLNSLRVVFRFVHSLTLVASQATTAAVLVLVRRRPCTLAPQPLVPQMQDRTHSSCMIYRPRISASPRVRGFACRGFTRSSGSEARPTNVVAARYVRGGV